MIRRTLPEGDLLIPQSEHALHSGRLAALHRELPEPSGAMIRAVALHDAGWPLLDDRPEPLAGGRAPHVFDHPPGQTLPAWRRSVAVARASGPLEALCVAGHFARFSGAFRDEIEPQAAVWRVGVPPGAERAGVDLLAWCDAVSLRLLCDPADGVKLPPGVSFRDGAISPWPFFHDDEIVDAVVGRLLPRRRWESPGALRSAWLEAPAYRLTVRLRPLD